MPRKIMGDTRKTVRIFAKEMCGGCGAPGTDRVDFGLPAGRYCDRCWKKMVDECRKRSW